VWRVFIREHVTIIMPSKKKAPDFEQSLETLDALVSTLEKGELSLEESLKAFESGIKLTRECQQQLAQAEQKVKLLVGEGDNLALTDFEQER